MDKNEDDALRLIDLKPLIVFSYQHCDRDIPAAFVHANQFLPLSTAYQRTRQTLKLSTYPFPPLLHNFCRYYSKPPSPHGEFKNVPLKLDFHNAVGTSQKTSIVGKLISTPQGHIVISINAAAENTSWKIDFYMR